MLIHQISWYSPHNQKDMSEGLNENPFMAITPAYVFTNGTDADYWFQQNCRNIRNATRSMKKRVFIPRIDILRIIGKDPPTDFPLSFFLEYIPVNNSLIYTKKRH